MKRQDLQRILTAGRFIIPPGHLILQAVARLVENQLPRLKDSMMHVLNVMTIPLFLISCVYFDPKLASKPGNPEMSKESTAHPGYVVGHDSVRNDVIPDFVGMDSLLCEYLSKNCPVRVYLSCHDLLSDGQKLKLTDCLKASNAAVRMDARFMSLFIPGRIIPSGHEIDPPSISFGVYQKYGSDRLYLLVYTDPHGFSNGGYVKYYLKIYEGKYYPDTRIEKIGFE